MRGHAPIIAWARIIIAWARIIIAWARIIIAWARIIIAWAHIIIAWPRISHCVGTHRSLREHSLVIAWARIIIAWARNNHFNIYFILGHSWPLWATVGGRSHHEFGGHDKSIGCYGLAHKWNNFNNSWVNMG